MAESTNAREQVVVEQEGNKTVITIIGKLDDKVTIEAAEARPLAELLQEFAAQIDPSLKVVDENGNLVDSIIISAPGGRVARPGFTESATQVEPGSTVMIDNRKSNG